MRAHQDQLIKEIFNYEDRYEFLDKSTDSLTVETWDGKITAFMATEYVERMFREVCFFGPLAALYGREVQQFLMTTKNQLRSLWKTFKIPSTWAEAQLSKRN